MIVCGGPRGQTEFQVNLKLGLTPPSPDPAKPEKTNRSAQPAIAAAPVIPDAKAKAIAAESAVAPAPSIAAPTCGGSCPGRRHLVVLRSTRPAWKRAIASVIGDARAGLLAGADSFFPVRRMHGASPRSHYSRLCWKS